MSSNNIILYSGSDSDGQGGVAIVMNPRVVIALISYNPISHRLIMQEWTQNQQLPTSSKYMHQHHSIMKKNRKTFMTISKSLLDTISDKEMCILMCDFNAKVGIGPEPNLDLLVLV